MEARAQFVTAQICMCDERLSACPRLCCNSNRCERLRSGLWAQLWPPPGIQHFHVWLDWEQLDASGESSTGSIEMVSWEGGTALWPMSICICQWRWSSLAKYTHKINNLFTKNNNCIHLQKTAGSGACLEIWKKEGKNTKLGVWVTLQKVLSLKVNVVGWLLQVFFLCSSHQSSLFYSPLFLNFRQLVDKKCSACK